MVKEMPAEDTYLGELCKNEHDHNNTGKSLRYENGECALCWAIEEFVGKRKRQRERAREYSREYSKTEKCKATQKKYRQTKAGKKVQKKALKRYLRTQKGKDNIHRKREKIHVDGQHRLNILIGSRIRSTLKNGLGGQRWEPFVGYTLIELEKHLLETMPKGYNWQDFLKGKLHIDHKIPVSAHRFEEVTHYDFKHCWALENLQLLTAKKNLSKSAKLPSEL